MSDLREIAQQSVSQGAKLRHDKTGTPYLAYVTESEGVELAVEVSVITNALKHQSHAIGRGGRRRDLADELADMFRMLNAL